ncbi:allene oxide synthase 1, chloroplastic-like [Cucurbita pepo subsp. pepo]|uniref:allene oxide synthase 1, chloroplastic-like n=1 Tax=Cucurbita pepo subsp. pepo TaxID=3664 RepID=UPI000C9D3F17|nr:allene oxide synthase 1, chloroplastic-like [Cucurbita pepo subsp. pepo]
MSVTSITLPCPQPHSRFPSQKKPLRSRSNLGFPSRRLIYAADGVSSSSSSSPPSSVQLPQRIAPTPEPTKLPLRKIPGDYGPPVFGALKDRQDYFYNQGREEYLKSRMLRYESTVYRTNMPPGPFITNDSRVVVLLDGKSFPVLFDNAKVEKKDLFTGTYMPYTELTGGYRVLSYIDPSEPDHEKLKQLIFFLLKHRRDKILPEFHSTFSELFQTLEKDLAAVGRAEYNAPGEQAAFNFLARSLFGANPVDTKLGRDAPKLIAKWVLFQLGPVLRLGLPKVVEELLLRTVRLPPSLIKADYRRLYDFFYQSSEAVFEEADRLGISREEACHNLLFTTCFNSFGGMKIFFPNMIKWIGRAGANLHTQLAREIRTAVQANGGRITMGAMEQMPLMKSVVYEAFRIEPPVPVQYGRAKKDLVVESHDAAFEIKEGEMICGFQPFATRDPKIFDRADEFVPDRFTGDGERLLKHVLWSNGPETQSPTVQNKQCAGKDFIVFISRLLVVEFFLRYDSFDIEVANSPLGAAITVTSLKKASF